MNDIETLSKMIDEEIEDSVPFLIEEIYRDLWSTEIRNVWDILPEQTRQRMFWHAVGFNNLHPEHDGECPVWQREKVAAAVADYIERMEPASNYTHGLDEQMLPLSEFVLTLRELAAKEIQVGCKACGYDDLDHMLTRVFIHHDFNTGKPEWSYETEAVIVWCMREKN